MPPKLQLLAVLAFAVAMLFIENQIQRLEDSRSRLGEQGGCSFHPKHASYFIFKLVVVEEIFVLIVVTNYNK